MHSDQSRQLYASEKAAADVSRSVNAQNDWRTIAHVGSDRWLLNGRRIDNLIGVVIVIAMLFASQ
jgi:hypothetical protein